MIRTAVVGCAVIGALLLFVPRSQPKTNAAEPTAPATARAAEAAERTGLASPPVLEPSDPIDRWLAQPAGVPRLATRPPESSRRTRSLPGETVDGDALPPETEAAVARDESAAGAAPSAVEPAAPLRRELKPELLRLQQQVRRALDLHRPRQLNTRDHDVWEVMHSLIANGVEQNVQVGRPGGQSANAIGWLCFNGACKGKKLFFLSNDRLMAQQGPGVQGHHGQFLAMLAQSKVMRDYPIKVRSREFTVADLIEFEKATCQPKSELTFKLIALAHYLDLDETWENAYGQNWSIPRLIREEIAQPIRGAACGGSHRLFGLSYAVNRRTRRGEPIDGEYRRAAKYVRDYHRYTFSLQNRDGSMSTNWFKGPGNRNDIDRKVQTSGHILEWLVLSLPEDQFQGPQMTRAVDFLSNALISGARRKWDIGAIGHAVHALNMYDQRLTAWRQSSGALAQLAPAETKP